MYEEVVKFMRDIIYSFALEYNSSVIMLNCMSTLSAVAHGGAEYNHENFMQACDKLPAASSSHRRLSIKRRRTISANYSNSQDIDSHFASHMGVNGFTSRQKLLSPAAVIRRGRGMAANHAATALIPDIVLTCSSSSTSHPKTSNSQNTPTEYTTSSSSDELVATSTTNNIANNNNNNEPSRPHAKRRCVIAVSTCNDTTTGLRSTTAARQLIGKSSSSSLNAASALRRSRRAPHYRRAKRSLNFDADNDDDDCSVGLEKTTTLPLNTTPSMVTTPQNPYKVHVGEDFLVNRLRAIALNDSAKQQHEQICSQTALSNTLAKLLNERLELLPSAAINSANFAPDDNSDPRGHNRVVSSAFDAASNSNNVIRKCKSACGGGGNDYDADDEEDTGSTCVGISNLIVVEPNHTSSSSLSNDPRTCGSLHYYNADDAEIAENHNSFPSASLFATMQYNTASADDFFHHDDIMQ